jgi:aminodeoxyfutalosine deaminase
MADGTVCFAASWIFSATYPPIEDGLLVVDRDYIVGVQSRDGRTADHDFGDAAILPGLVNAHAHLDLTGMRGIAPPSADFTSWLRQVVAHRRQRTSTDIADDIQAGLAASLAAGTTLIGDISGDGSSWAELAEAPLRAVVFRELLGLSKDRAEQAWRSAQEWLGSCALTQTCRPGLSPHAPYSARVSLIKAAAATGLPIAIHLAESSAERELLVDQSGPFVPFLQELGVWDPLGLAKSPEHVLRLTAGNAPVLFVHGNFLAATAPIPPHASVVYCPRTHEAFGHPPHPFREMMARGVRVALGTDSLASNPDLSILNEARFVRAIHPDLDGASILKMATLRGAEALGWADQAGSLETGKSADFVVVPLDGNGASDPHDLWLESDAEISETWFRGRRVWPTAD